MAEIITHHAILARARELGVNSITVGFSGGKDALVVLDICSKYFARVEAYFLYLVPDLSFQEHYMQYIERRYSISIHRLPSPAVADWLKTGGFRLPSRAAASTRRIKRIDIENHLRQKTGIEWFATGEKTIDSVERNAMIRKVRGVDPKRRQIWPVAYWTNSSIYNYLKINKIPLPPDYRIPIGGRYIPRSFGTLSPDALTYIREQYPADYQKIIAMFPLLPASMVESNPQNQQPVQQLTPASNNGQKEIQQG